MRTYSLIKNNISFERYLSLVYNLKHRQAVTRLRLSAHKLPIEFLRYCNIPRENRICCLCDSDKIGNEYHCMMECTNPKFKFIREDFLKNIVTVNSLFDNFTKNTLFKYILSVNDESIVKQSAKFCYDIISVFDDCIDFIL